jgi:hypothetical protein
MDKIIPQDERRRFERLAIPIEAGVTVSTADGKSAGVMTVLGRGGMRVDTKIKFKNGDVHELVIHDASEGIRRVVKATVRDVTATAAGFQFEDLDPDAAVEIGVIIGKYYSAPHGHI